MKSDRVMKSLTGLSVEKFHSLLPTFKTVYTEEKRKEIKQNKNRQRDMGAGRKHSLETIEAKLFFILFYLKVYPTFDLAGFIFDVNRSQTNRWFHVLLPILEKSLDRNFTLPKRKVASMDEFMELFPEIKDVFIDGTEREINRPQSDKKQKKYYSGKKKRHTVKNTIVTDERKRVLILTPTSKGNEHDKKQYDKNHLDKQIPDDVTKWVDTGYQGIQRTTQNVMMPKKRVKGKSLTKEEREENRTISSIRIVVEHALAGIKRLKCVVDKYRNKKPHIEDELMLVAAGIWNHQISKAY